MSNRKAWIAWGGIVLAVLLAIVALVKGGPVGPQGPPGVQGPQGDIKVVTTTIPPVTSTLVKTTTTPVTTTVTTSTTVQVSSPTTVTSTRTITTTKPSSSSDYTVSKRVGQSSDDCSVYWNGSSWIFEVKATNGFPQPAVGYINGSIQKAGGGMRFSSISIPQGATIDSAYITFTAYDSYSGQVVKSVFTGQLGNATTFSTYSNYQSRDRTETSVDWNSIGAWSRDSTYESPDLSSVVQEIVDDSSWVKGGPLVIFWEDLGGTSTQSNGCGRTQVSYETDASKAAVLHIGWSN
jgi:hypothetical protein